MTIVDLARVDIPIESGLKRDKPARTEILDISFWDCYDQTTLFYDIVFDKEKKRVRAYAPRLWGIERDIRDSKILIDGKIKYSYSFKRGRYIDIFEFNDIFSAELFSIEISGISTTVAISQAEVCTQGSNGIFTLSKNNDLEWIKDWATFYVKQHKADTVVIADNGSTSYDLTALDDSIAKIEGIKNVFIFSADLKYGPSSKVCTRNSEAEILQKALLNISLDRFFSSNSIMLNVDIDELVVSKKEQSIFDATRHTYFGHISITGEWVHSRLETPNVRHADHVWRNKSDKTCPNKFTIASWSPFRRFDLQVHDLSRINRNHLKSRGNFSFLHCKQISTSWKYNRAAVNDADYVLDTDLQEKMRRFFPDASFL